MEWQAQFGMWMRMWGKGGGGAAGDAWAVFEWGLPEVQEWGGSRGVGQSCRARGTPRGLAPMEEKVGRQVCPRQRRRRTNRIGKVVGGLAARGFQGEGVDGGREPTQSDACFIRAPRTTGTRSSPFEVVLKSGKDVNKHACCCVVYLLHYLLWGGAA